MKKLSIFFHQVYDYILNCKPNYDYKQHCRTIVRESTHNIRADEYEKSLKLLNIAGSIYAKNQDTVSHYYFEHLAKKAALLSRNKNYNEGLILYQKIYNNSKRKNITTSHAWNTRRLANAHRSLKDYKNSEKYFKEAIEIYKKIGSKSRQYIRTLDQYGDLLYNLGNEEAAISQKEQCLEIRKKLLNEDEVYLVSNHKTLAWMYRKTGKLKQALEHYSVSIKILEKIHNDDHTLLHNTFDDIALTLLKLDRHTEADHYYTRYHNALKPRIKEQINHLSDEDFINMSSFYQDELDELKYLTHHSAYDNKKWTKNVYNNILLFRTILLEDRKGILNNNSQHIDLNSIIDITYEDIWFSPL